MIKNIIIGMLVVLCFVLSVYGLVQQTGVQKLEKQAYDRVYKKKEIKGKRGQGSNLKCQEIIRRK